LLFLSTATQPRPSLCETPQALTMSRADLAVAVSKLRRVVLPSMAINRPALVSCRAPSQDSRHRSNSAGLRRAEDALPGKGKALNARQGRSVGHGRPVATGKAGRH
jgi:hypothetical protein